MTMLKGYLWFTLCLQFALIYATRIRRSQLDEHGHVHIKIHVPEISRTPPHYYAKHQPFRYKSKKSASSSGTHHKENFSPYEFDFYGMEEGDNSLMSKQVIHDGKFGPVLFNNDITTTALQQPISQQFMQQLFTPHTMSSVRTENTASNELNAFHDIEEPESLDENDDGVPSMYEYLRKLNKHSDGDSEGESDGDGEDENERAPYFRQSLQQQFYNTVKQQRQQQKRTRTKSQNEFYQHAKQQKKTYPRQRQLQQQQQQQRQQQQMEMLRTDSDELDTSEEASSEYSLTNDEDMTADFNGLHPISQLDMFGSYATPLTTTTKSTSSGRHRSNQGLDYHETIPSYTSITENWLQYQQQHPEVQQQQEQQQFDYHHQNHQHKKSQQGQQYITKVHQPQFVLQPSTPLRLTSSSFPSSSSSSSSSLTSPISTEFDTLHTNTGSGSGSSNSFYSSPPASTWIFEHFDPHQHNHQHQYSHQQQQQQQPHTLKSHKKPKNRAKQKQKQKQKQKHKRNRIIVE